MAGILKADGFVIKRFDHGDSSRIITLFTRETGKMSGIVKGAKSSKSKIGTILDLLNKVSVVYYDKESRDIQLITQAELTGHYSKLKNSFEHLAYASSVLELLDKLLLDHEVNERLYSGTERIFDLFNTLIDKPEFYFAKYLFFFIGETGYQLPLDKCVDCERELTDNPIVYLNYNTGFYCSDCGSDHTYFEKIPKELFNLITCLNIKNCRDENFHTGQIKQVIKILERYLMFHNPDFKGLKTLKIF